MERDHIRQNQDDSIELTARAQSAYSRSGGNFMPDGSSGPGPEELGPTDELSAEEKKAEIKTTKEEAREQLLSLPIPRPIDEPGIPIDEPQKRLDHKRAYEIIAPDLAKKAGLLGQAKWKEPEGEKDVEVVEFSRVLDGKIHLKIKVGDEIKEVIEDELVYLDEPKVVGGGSGGPPEAPPAPLRESADEPEASLDEEAAKRLAERRKHEEEDRKRLHKIGLVAPEDSKDVEAKSNSETVESKNAKPTISETNVKKEEESREQFDEEGGEVNKQFIKQLYRFLFDEEVKKQLMSSNPVFTSSGKLELPEGVTDFAQFIERIVPGRDLIIFADVVSKKGIVNPETKERIEISDETRKLLFEWAMNRIITIPNADDDSPYELSLELSNYRDKLKAMAQSNFRGENDKEFHARISSLASVEATFHNVRILIASGSEKYEDLFKSLRTPSLDFINNDLEGVTEVINEFERSFLIEASQSKTALRTSQTENAIQRARNAILELHRKGKLKDGDRIINEWELDRALRLGETFFRATQRAAVYITAGDTTGITESLYDEYADRQVAPAKMTWRRFWYPSAHGKPATVKLMDRTINNMEEQWDEKATNAKSKKSVLGQTQVENIGPLMGQSREEMFYNYLGIFDIASHASVRGPKLYLSPIKMENGSIGGQTMYDFLYDKKMMKIEDKALLEDIETKVLGQTSYFSALSRHGALSTQLREKLWRKRAIIDPVAVASLRPDLVFKDFTPEQEDAWGKLRSILDEYHLVKLMDEKVKYSGIITNEEMTQEAEKFRKANIDEDVRYQIFNSSQFKEIIDALDENGNPLYSAEQKNKMEEVFRLVVDRGIKAADYLAVNTSATRHNYAIDDAPIVAWYEESGQGLNDNNFVRNFSDQHNLAENGYGTLTPLINDPKLGVNGEVFDNAVKGFSQVLGDEPARDLVEGMMRGWLQMAEQKEKTKWFPTMHGLRGKARSELEEYFGNIGIYWSETDKKQWLEGRAYQGTIENELKKPRNQRRLNQLKGKEGAGRRALMIETFREDIVKILPLSFIAAILISSYNTFREALRESAKDI